MSRPEYLTEEFYKTIQIEAQTYANDYNAIRERRKKLEEIQRQRSLRDEESYSLLKSFGVV